MAYTSQLSYHSGMSCSQIADGGDTMKISRMTEKFLRSSNKAHNIHVIDKHFTH
jgi:hypothetical protein